MVRGELKLAKKINKRNFSHKTIHTSHLCLPFMNHRFKSNRISNLDFKIRSVNMTEPFNQKAVRYSEKIANLKQKDWDHIKAKLIKKFTNVPEKRKYVRNC